MMMRTQQSSATTYEIIPNRLIDEVCGRLAEGKPIRQSLPDGGQLNMDRLLPFLCVYRRNPRRTDNGTGLFVKSEAAFLVAPGVAPVRQGLRQLVQRIAATAAAQLGAFMILEIWSADDRDQGDGKDPRTGELLLPGPAFRIVTRPTDQPDDTVHTLQTALQRIKIHRQLADVQVQTGPRIHPPGMTQLISAADARRIGCHVVGLEIRPIYRDGLSGDIYLRVHRSLTRAMARAMKKSFFTFAMHRTSVRPQHYFALGRKSLPQQVLAVDRQLAEISQQFKFLLLVTPVNAEGAWQEFQTSEFKASPRFYYRPLGADPMLLKRRLMRIATEQVDDPTLSHVMRQTQDELDRQITMLSDIGTRRFLHGSLQVFGGVESTLLEIANRILQQVPPRTAEPSGVETSIGARAFVKHATQEIEYYQRQVASFTATAVVREDMYSGLLSTGGNLLVGRAMRIPLRRIDALLQHEVGTHLVTYYNGKMQSLRLLQVGLAGYDGLQEGIAVLAEYLVGGLTSRRMRTLAARVVATDCLVRGAQFPETFALLVDKHGIEPRAAYTITLRVYRGGGLTKDAVYLRGFVDIIKHLAGGGPFEPLFVGKLAADHIPVIQELLYRGALKPPTLQPRYLENPAAQSRLAAIRNGLSIEQVVRELVPSNSE